MNDSERVITNFHIQIGQSSVAGIPIGEPSIIFIINERYTMCRLDDLKKWIDCILESKGNRNKKAYKAKENLDSFFADLFHPFMKLPEPPNE